MICETVIGTPAGLGSKDSGVARGGYLLMCVSHGKTMYLASPALYLPVEDSYGVLEYSWLYPSPSRGAGDSPRLAPSIPMTRSCHKLPKPDAAASYT